MIILSKVTCTCLKSQRSCCVTSRISKCILSVLYWQNMFKNKWNNSLLILYMF